MDRLETFAKTEAGFSIICSDRMQPGKEAKFILILTSGISTARFPFGAVIFREQSLSTGVVLVEEVSGNGNGGADPGETIRIKVELLNASSQAESVTAWMETEQVCLASGEIGSGPVEVPALSGAWMEFDLDISPAVQAGMATLPLRFSGSGAKTIAGITLWLSYAGRTEQGTEILTCQAEPGHSGYFDKTPRKPLGLKWESILPGDGTLVCQPVAAEGRVFVCRKEPAGGITGTGEANFLYTLEDSGGEIIHRKRLPGESIAGPFSISCCTGVVLASCGGYIHAVDVASAEIVWSWSPDPAGERTAWRAGEPTVCAGSVICEFHAASGQEKDFTCALDLFTGKVAWREENGEGRFGTDPPACFDGSVFSVDGSGTLVARKVETGESEWSEDAGIVPAAPVIAWRGKVLATGSNGTICAFDAATGAPAWRFETGGTPAGPACVDPYSGEAVVIVRSGELSRLVTVRLDTGTAGETFSIEGTGFSGIVSAGSGGGCQDAECASAVMFGGSTHGRFDLFERGPGGFAQTAIYSAGDISVLSPSFHDGGAVFVSVNTNEDDRVISFGAQGDPGPAGPRGLTCILPNPFNPSVRIRFDLPRAAGASLVVYDVSGRLVRVLVDGALEAGPHETEWDGRNDRGESLAAGVYFCRLMAGQVRDSRKMILLR